MPKYADRKKERSPPESNLKSTLKNNFKKRRFYYDNDKKNAERRISKKRFKIY